MASWSARGREGLSEVANLLSSVCKVVLSCTGPFFSEKMSLSLVSQAASSDQSLR